MDQMVMTRGRRGVPRNSTKAGRKAYWVRVAKGRESSKQRSDRFATFGPTGRPGRVKTYRIDDGEYPT